VVDSLPVVYTAQPDDLRAAVEGVRERVAALAESRLYMVAVCLTVLSRVGRATTWRSWDSAPPTEARQFGRADITWAMRQLFGTTPDALLRADSSAREVLDEPSRVMLDVLYAPGGPLTLVADTPVGTGRRDTVKLAIDDSGWVWSDSHGPGHPSPLVEYNPVNTLNQQNGIACALAADAAVETNPANPGSVYAVKRNECPYRQQAGPDDPVCSLNTRVCGGSGGGGARAATKPRLLVPPVADSNALLMTPGTLTILVAQAQSNGALLPRARDLSLITSWCSTKGKNPMDNARLVQLLGASGVELLTDWS
jgi:hypothetical protein